MSKLIEAYTDGACIHNPGDGGWGVLIKFTDGTVKKIHGGVHNTTNNRMEMTAVIKALQYIPSGSNVKVVTDSQYVQKGITQWITKWKRNGWKTAKHNDVKNKDLWIQLSKETASHTIHWEWVKGHSGHRENEIADKLANMGADLMLQTPPILLDQVEIDEDDSNLEKNISTDTLTYDEFKFVLSELRVMEERNMFRGELSYANNTIFDVNTREDIIYIRNADDKIDDIYYDDVKDLTLEQFRSRFSVTICPFDIVRI